MTHTGSRWHATPLEPVRFSITEIQEIGAIMERRLGYLHRLSAVHDVVNTYFTATTHGLIYHPDL